MEFSPRVQGLLPGRIDRGTSKHTSITHFSNILISNFHKISEAFRLSPWALEIN